MDVESRDRWVKMLRIVAEASTAAIPPGVAPWFQAHRGIITPPSKIPTSPDDQLWAAIAQSNPIPESLSGPSHKSQNNHAAPLFAFTSDDTIEVWTERDLSGMHAASRLIANQPDRRWHARIQSALDWHLEHTQPDNATGHPWAIHVFLLRSMTQDDHHARLYAETLLHNCQMQSGAADGLSAEILRDAADALESNSIENQ